jgi:transaldolase
MTPLESLVACGTKLWLDSVDPDLVLENRRLGATGATSNPIIIADVVKTGRFDAELRDLLEELPSDEDIAWQVTDQIVRRAQEVFLPVYEETKGNDGYVSFELDPLLEDPACPLSLEEKRSRYVELGATWSKGRKNRMIKVPATEAGLAALEDLAAAGVTLNVTLLFTQRQYHAARDAIWRGAQKRGNLAGLKSVYSIFVSRIDVYTAKHVSDLSDAAQGLVGIVNAQRLWEENQEFWKDKKLPHQQEIIFASTGVKNEGDPPDKYVSALAGSDIQTNPPATNAAVQKLPNKQFTKTVDRLPPPAVLNEIDAKVDFQKMEDVLMEEGLKKFADPQKALIALIGKKRKELAAK